MPVTGKTFRRRRADSESEEDEDSEEVRLKLEETREVQNLRKRPNGVSAVALLVGEKVQEETTLVVSGGVLPGQWEDVGALQ